MIALNFTEPKSFRDDEQGLLLALATQCGQALDRAKLYSELQERADAASVLAHVGDGVFQVDLDDRVTLWNRGAEVLTGLKGADTLGRRIAELFVGWDEARSRVSIIESPVAFGRREAVPVQVGSRELWLAISGVAKAEGVVYAFRDVTESKPSSRLARISWRRRRTSSGPPSQASSARRRRCSTSLSKSGSNASCSR